MLNVNKEEVTVCIFLMMLPEFHISSFATWSISHTWKPDLWKEVRGIYWYFDSNAQEMGPAGALLAHKPYKLFTNETFLDFFYCQRSWAEMTKLHTCAVSKTWNTAIQTIWDAIGIFQFHIYQNFRRTQLRRLELKEDLNQLCSISDRGVRIWVVISLSWE